nr:toprim domain-containing protein [bacterium]
QITFDNKADGERDRLFQIMEEATSYFESQFTASTEAKEYITKRGIIDTTRSEFRIGWAPEGWSNLFIYLKKKGWPEVVIEKAGLAKKGDKGDFYDRFRGRVMFPISDSSGRIVAFSGRILKDDGKSAKYLNSPDTPLYDKSLILYGLDKAKGEIRRLNYSILVEGQMDLILSHQAGIKNTVASSGTALTDETVGETGTISNLGLVRRLSPNVIIAFDSDSAGRKAALRAAGIALSLSMDVKIADLVGGKDPADLVVSNPEDWKKVLREAKPIIEFELGNVLRDTPDPRKVPRALRDRVFPFLARIESRMDKAHFVKMISDKANITEGAVWDDLQTLETKIKMEKGNPKSEILDKSEIINSKPSTKSNLDLIERRMFGLLALVEKTSSAAATIYREQIQKIAGDRYDMRLATVESLIGDILFEAESFYGNEEKNWDFHMKELIVNFEENTVNEELSTAMSDLRKAEKAGDVAALEELAKKCQVLSMKKSEVSKKRKSK